MALTTDAFADTRARVPGAGMNKFLMKPVRVDDNEALLVAMVGARALPPPGAMAGASRPKASTPPMTPSTAHVPAAAPAADRRRFRASDVAMHLDMTVIGDVCVGVTLAGYQSVLIGFLDDDGGSAAHLLAALDRADSAVLKTLAHAVQGAAASLGLRSIHALALRIESEGTGYDPAGCAAAAAQVRELQGTTRALLQRMGFIQPPP